MNQKFSIFDKEGVDLYLKQVNLPVQEKPAELYEIARPKGYTLKAVLALILLALLISSMMGMKKYISQARNRSQELVQIREQFARVTAEMNLGSGSFLSFAQKKELIDSLILASNKLLHRFPESTEEYAEIWPAVILYRYLLEWQNHNFQEASGDLDIKRMDLALEQKVALLDSEISDILNLLYDLSYFHHFKQRYPSDPTSAKEPLPEAYVQHLLQKSDDVKRRYSKQSIRLDVQFRTIANEARMIMNTYQPEIKQWVDFWHDYNRCADSQDTLEVHRIVGDLKFRFPEMQILQEEQISRLYGARNLNWGILYACSDSSIIQKQFAALLKYLTHSTGYSLSLKEYSSYTLLREDFREGKLDFCYLPHDDLHRFSQSQDLNPIALRLSGKAPLVSYFLYSSSMPIRSSQFPFEALKGKKLLIDASIYSLAYFKTLEFFAVKGQALNDLLDRVDASPCNSTSFAAGYDFVITTSENRDRLKRSPITLQESDLHIADIPSEALFANELTMDSVSIINIKEALLAPKDQQPGFPNFCSWGTVDSSLLNRYAMPGGLIQPVQSNLVVVNCNELESNEQKNALNSFIQSMFDYGYNVTSEQNYQLYRASVSLPQVKKMTCRVLQNKAGLTLKVNVLGKSGIIYTHSSSVPSSNRKDYFLRILEEMSTKTSFQGEVVEIINDQVYVMSPVNKHLKSDSKFEIYRNTVEHRSNDKILVVNKEHIATGRYVGLDGRRAVLRIDHVGSGRLRIGDNVNILP